jgi:hypothetical protein
MHGEMASAYGILIGKTKEKTHLEQLIRRCTVS